MIFAVASISAGRPNPFTPKSDQLFPPAASPEVYNISQYEELGAFFSTQMKDCSTTNSHYLTYKVGRLYFLNLRILPSWEFFEKSFFIASLPLSRRLGVDPTRHVFRCIMMFYECSWVLELILFPKWICSGDNSKWNWCQFSEWQRIKLSNMCFKPWSEHPPRKAQ